MSAPDPAVPANLPGPPVNDPGLLALDHEPLALDPVVPVNDPVLPALHPGDAALVAGSLRILDEERALVERRLRIVDGDLTLVERSLRNVDGELGIVARSPRILPWLRRGASAIRRAVTEKAICRVGESDLYALLKVCSSYTIEVTISRMSTEDPPDIVLVDRKLDRSELARLVGAYFEDMVKYVVDVERRVAAVGGELHADAEKLLLEEGSRQADLWGANYYPGRGAEDCIEYTSLINIRPSQGNRSMLIEDSGIKERVREITFALIGEGEPLE